MELKPVLIIAYFFPPLGGAGTQRFAKFVKWLPRLGYRPIVVACEPATSAGMPEDSTLLADVPEEAVVARIAEPGDRCGLPVRIKAGMALGFWMDHEAWVHAAMPEAERLAKEHGARAVVTTVSPYATAAMGRVLRARLGIPWILDLRDPWALDGWRLWLTPVHTWGDGWVMKRALRDADIVVANCPVAGEVYTRFARLDPRRVRVIPNGFDPDDFAGFASEPAQEREFRLVHVGTLHDPRGRSGRAALGRSRLSLRTVQELGRTGRYLLEAIGRVRERSPELYGHLRLDLYGNVHKGHKQLAEELRITEIFREHGYVNHAAAVAATKGADALFVPLHGLPEGETSLVVPGKLYEVLASGRPVLACVPAGDAERLVRLTKGGVVCRPDDVGAIAAGLGSLIEQWKDGRPARGAAARLMAPFARERLTRRLAACIDQALGGPAGAADSPWDEVAALAQNPGGESNVRNESADAMGVR